MSTAQMQMQVPGRAPVLLGKYATRRDGDAPAWMWSTDSPKAEARALFSLAGKNGDTVDSLRAMIVVPDGLRAILVEFAESDPSEAVWVAKGLKFRAAVLQEFDRLAAQAEGRLF